MTVQETMDEAELRAFCAKTLNGQSVEEFRVFWEYPGHLELLPQEPVHGPDTDDSAVLIATPDFINGNPNRITFAVLYAGHFHTLPDEEVSWIKDTALEVWCAAVSNRLKAVRSVFEVIRRQGVSGFRQLVDSQTSTEST